MGSLRGALVRAVSHPHQALAVAITALLAF